MIVQDTAARRGLVDRLLELGAWVDRKGASVELATRLMATVADTEFPGAIIPRFLDGHFVYYLVAESSADWRRLAPPVVASVGVTLSGFVGLPATPDPDDPFEQALAGAGLIFGRVEPADEPKLRQRAAEGLVGLVDGVHRAGQIAQPSLRTTASLLRDFDLALALKDRPAAESVMARLKVDLRLEGLNHLFLQIETVANSDGWSELWNGDYFEDAAKTFRPPRITRALLRATYWDQLDTYVVRGDVLGALEAMKEVVLPRWGDLAAARPSGSDPDVGLPLLLASAIAQTPAWISKADARLESWPAYQREFAVQLADEHGLAWHAASTLEPAPVAVGSKADLRAALISAALASESGALAEVLARCRALPATDLEEVLDHPLAQRAWELVAGEAHAPGIRDWLEWASRLAELEVMEARTWAREAITVAPVERVLDSTAALTAFTTSLNEAASKAESTMSAVLPLLLDWLSRDPEWPRRDYVALYRNLLDILLLATETSQLLVAGVGRLVSAVLAVGLAPSDYREVCRDLGDWVGGAASVTTIDALVDLGELTVSYPCADAAARAGFWVSLVSGLRIFEPRLDGIQVAVLKDLDRILSEGALMADLGLREPTPPDDVALPALRGRVAIYTLVESVARRVKESIEVAAPNVRVDYTTDKVGNERLLALAREADVFAIDWSRAKHAATDFIRGNRGNRPVLFTSGSGSSSIAREILEALRGGSMPVGTLAK